MGRVAFHQESWMSPQLSFRIQGFSIYEPLCCLKGLWMPSISSLPSMNPLYLKSCTRCYCTLRHRCTERECIRSFYTVLTRDNASCRVFQTTLKLWRSCSWSKTVSSIRMSRKAGSSVRKLQQKGLMAGFLFTALELGYPLRFFVILNVFFIKLRLALYVGSWERCHRVSTSVYLRCWQAKIVRLCIRSKTKSRRLFNILFWIQLKVFCLLLYTIRKRMIYSIKSCVSLFYHFDFFQF